VSSSTPKLLGPIFGSIELGEGPMGQYFTRLELSSTRTDSVRKYCGIKRQGEIVNSASTLNVGILLLIVTQLLLISL
jgi:hypothetical protein